MNTFNVFFFLLFLSFISVGQAQVLAPDWSHRAVVPEGGRWNPYDLSQEEFAQARVNGRRHVLEYPVTVTNIVVPGRPIENVFKGSPNPLKQFLRSLFQGLKLADSMEEMFAWIGLTSYPEQDSLDFPYPKNGKTRFGMGYTEIERYGVKGFTLSCAECHVGQLFGQPVFGMSNRFARANEYFHKGKKAMNYAFKGGLRWLTEATPEEMQLFMDSKEGLKFVGTKMPVQLGLDTSLAQVSLSLARRAKDPYATKDPRVAKRPRKEPLIKKVADSKPAVWWTLKYKTRWLSDGSVVSGNPIFTNFIWNEIGRATDLKILEGWLSQNSQTVRDLTTAVFSTEAPSFFDFYDLERFDIASAQRGEKHYLQRCARCHGVYVKGWSSHYRDLFKEQDLVKTQKVVYAWPTAVMDVGTDPGRYEGMVSLEQLNDLSISKANDIVIAPQKGYVAPPLNGIWARWPYFHNNSIPNLCALLTVTAERPKSFWMGEPLDPESDFDWDCNGYPVGSKTPEDWKQQDRTYLYQTKKAGSSNSGHDLGIFMDPKTGEEFMSERDKLDLIRFLQTL